MSNVEKALNKTRNSTKNPVLGEIVKDLNTLFKKEKIFVISDYGINVFKSNGEKIEQDISWFDIKSYDFDGKNKISIKIPPKDKILNFGLSENSKIIQLIETYLQQVLLPMELLAINPKLKSSPTPKSAFYRVIRKHQKLRYEMNSIIRFSQDFVVLTEDNIEDYLDVLPLIKAVKSIHIKLPFERNPASLEKLLPVFLSRDSNLEHIHFDGFLGGNVFDQIIKNLIDNKQTKIKALSFTNSKLAGSYFQTLSTACNVLGINCLSFHNACDHPHQYYCLYNEFLPELNKSPRFINLKRSTSINLQTIFTQRTVALSLEQCDLQIATVFDFLSTNRKNLTNLRILNIGGNMCSQSFQQNTQIPESIRSIFASNIQFRGFNLRAFFEILFNNLKSGLRLTFSNASASDKEWNQLDDFFSYTNFNSLMALNWSGNPISRKFISFLHKNKNLYVLDISNTLDGDTMTDTIKLIGSYLENAKNLERFIMKGSQTKTIGSKFGYILNAIVTNGNINDIDMSEQRGGDKSLEQIRYFAETKGNQIKANFDGAEPQTCKALLDTIDVCLKKGRNRIKLSFPEHDLNLYLSNGITNDEYLQIMNNFSNTYTGKKQNESSGFDTPFRVPKSQPTDDFPEYICQDELNELLSAKPNSPSPHKNKLINQNRNSPQNLIGNNALNYRNISQSQQKERSKKEWIDGIIYNKPQPKSLEKKQRPSPTQQQQPIPKQSNEKPPLYQYKQQYNQQKDNKRRSLSPDRIQITFDDSPQSKIFQNSPPEKKNSPEVKKDNKKPELDDDFYHHEVVTSLRKHRRRRKPTKSDSFKLETSEVLAFPREERTLEDEIIYIPNDGPTKSLRNRHSRSPPPKLREDRNNNKNSSPDPIKQHRRHRKQSEQPQNITPPPNKPTLKNNFTQTPDTDSNKKNENNVRKRRRIHRAPQTLDGLDRDHIIDSAISSLFDEKVVPTRRRRLPKKRATDAQTMDPEDTKIKPFMNSSVDVDFYASKDSYGHNKGKKNTRSKSPDLRPIQLIGKSSEKQTKQRKQPPKLPNRRRYHTLDGDDTSFEIIESSYYSSQNESSTSSSSVYDYSDEDSEPLFISQSKKNDNELKQKRKRRHRTQEDEEDKQKWTRPVFPSYPVPDSIWTDIDVQFNFDSLLKNIQSIPALSPIKDNISNLASSSSSSTSSTNYEEEEEEEEAAPKKKESPVIKQKADNSDSYYYYSSD